MIAAASAIFFLAATAVAANGADAALDSTPTWAIIAPLPRTPQPGTIQDQSVPGSRKKYSELELRGRASAVDWFPSAHPRMPPAVGGKPGLTDACAYCHLPDGSGRPENAALAGLPYTYILEQARDFKSGARSPIPNSSASRSMAQSVRPVSDADIEAAARYYSKLPYRKRVRIVETDTAPHVTANSVYFFDETVPHEPLKERILEGPDDASAFLKRDPRVTYTAYVPLGSIGRGATLAQGAQGGRASCASCHGAGLKGGPAPPLAGRYPTVIFRQLYAFQHGVRNGKDAGLMKSRLAGLSMPELIDLSAYCASLSP